MNKRIILFIYMGFFLAAAIRIWCFSVNIDNFEFGGSDESWSKINIALQWVLHPEETVPDANFGPLHSYLIATFLYTNAEKAVLYSRYVSLLFGVLFPVLYFYLLRDIFDRTTAFLGLFLVGLYPLHILLSTVSLPETIACFMVMSAFYLFVRFFLARGVWRLICSAIALTFACMLRFECWLLLPFFPCYLFFARRLFKMAFLYGCVVSIFPLFWMHANYYINGNIFGFLMVSSGVAQQTMEQVDWMQRLWGFTGMLGKTLTYEVLFCGAVGLVLSLRKKKALMLACAFVYVLCVFTGLSLKGSFDSHIVRYSVFTGILFLPFAAYGLSCFCVGRKTYGVLVVCVIIAYKLFLMLGGYLAPLHASAALKETTAWMHENIEADQRVLLEMGDQHPYILLNGDVTYDQTLIYDLTRLRRGEEVDFSEHIKKSSFIVMSKHEYDGLLRYKVLPLLNANEWERVINNKERMVYRRISKKKNNLHI